MQAVVVHGANDLRVQEVANPKCGPDQVLVALHWGGICGSDIAYWKHGASGTAILREALILGHEVAGHIEQIGEHVPVTEQLHRGAKVAIHPATLVGHHSLPPELQGRSNLWPEVRYFGSAAFLPHEQGGFCAFRTVRPDQLRFLPANVSTKQAALAEPFAVALHALARGGQVEGRRVLVNGSGPIGALCVAAAKAKGAREVFASDLSDSCLNIARKMGADEVVNLSLGQELPADVDICFEASGAASALKSVIAATRRGGVLVQVGNLPATDISASLGNLVTREIEYRGSYRFIDEISEAISLLASGVDLSPLQTHEFDISQAEQAFAVAADRQSGSSKVMLKLS